ncbi:kinase-like domain-containing protein [Nemania sp. FL0031]|nr:kinase-like domain-containing protein [Nemania sp. FL0031]
MFPWANGGNLRDTWQRLDNPHIRNETLVSWVLHQLCGLSSALHCLHNRQWSHGDLKPENILRLSADDDPGLLVIADMGLAEFNDKITLERSSTASSTRRYKDPEDTIYPPKIVSRRSDIWSFGCVAMEFLIWLLYGCEGLQRFQGESESFYSIIQKRVEVNSTTTQWSDYMMDDDPRCRPGTDLRPLLQLIRTRLLVFETPTSVKDEASSSTTITPSNPTKDEPIPDFEIEQANVNHAPMQSYGEAAVSRGRADSKELYETLSEIVRTSKFGSTSRDPPWRELCRLWGPMNKIALPW